MNWTRGHTIGHGSTATVSAATTQGCDGSIEVLAVKSIELAKSEFLQREQKILSFLSSPYIVGYKGYDISMENNKLVFNLMMEYLPAGTVTDVVRKFRARGRLKEGMISCYARQIVQGLEYLHSNGLVHCDIKGSNILVSETGAKIADFGCAKWVFPVAQPDREEAKPAVVFGGTPLFMAPEVARGEEQGFAADIWALGCTIIEMVTGGSPPWPNATNAASLIYRIGFSEELPEIPDFLSEKGKDFLKKCLRRDPNHRWTAEQLLKHPFLEEIIDIPKENYQEFKTSSPTSILDQGIWNSVEESKTVSGMITTTTTNNTRNSSNSPSQRLSKLLSSESRNPNWNWDENWITVRRNRSRGNARKDGKEEMTVGSLLVGSASRGADVESSTADENSRELPFCKNLNFKNSISSNNNYNNSNFRRCIDEIFVLRNLNFEWQTIEPIDIL